MNAKFKSYLLEITQSLSCSEKKLVQTLWSGYGTIKRYRLNSSKFKTVIVKHIVINSDAKHPRGWDTKASHQRKVKSYLVERNWYENYNTACHHLCKTPQFLGSYQEGKELWIVLEDLDEQFAVRKSHVDLLEIKVCLQWLAQFHAIFLNYKTECLWPIGTYWHLATRPDEFNKLQHEELKIKAHLIDQKLNECKFQTIVHGDAKLANFCFSEDGSKVAAVDFQYAGGGCGMKDVAYLLGSCLEGSALFKYEKDLLNHYFNELNYCLKTSLIEGTKVEKEWRKMYPYACADFTRFLLGWMPSHEKINSYQLEKLKNVLESH